MKHLSSEEIINFLSISEINPSSLLLASTVATHIRSCPQCLAEVQAFQLVMDELNRRNRDAEVELIANEVCRRSGVTSTVDQEK